jgi:GMP synthase (glutamine-hydrolysing)
MHESFEAPGAIEKWLKLNNCGISYTRLYDGDTLPESTKSFDFLIIMGGPQSPDTTLSECPHFNANKEIAFIKQCIEKNKFIFGICLGAQLIGEALGAKFYHSPNREIGVFELTLTEDGKLDPIIGTFPEKFMVGHWHGDMPGLTKESKVLASSEGCPRQIVKYSPKIYGFQCHFEFTPDSIEGMIQNCSHELEVYKSLPYIEDAGSLRSHDYKSMNKLLFSFLDYMKSSTPNLNIF